MDAAGYFVGPSINVGTDYLLKNKTSLSTYFHYFHDNLHNEIPGYYETGKYNSLILALLLQQHLSRNLNKGFEVGGGVAIQRTTDEHVNTYDSGVDRRTIFVGALRFGYKFPIKRNALAIELNAVGPHMEEIGEPPYVTHRTELLTQLSLGGRFIFNFKPIK